MADTGTGAKPLTTVRTGGIPQWTLPDRLAKARAEAGLDQDELAGAMGVSRQSVSNWERGYARPKRPFIWAWADVTGVDRHWLLWGEEPPSDGNEATATVLPRLDSNQQPFGYDPVPDSWVHEFRKMINSNDQVTG